MENNNKLSLPGDEPGNKLVREIHYTEDNIEVRTIYVCDKDNCNCVGSWGYDHNSHIHAPIIRTRAELLQMREAQQIVKSLIP